MPCVISFEGVCKHLNFDPSCIAYDRTDTWECVDSFSPKRLRVMFKRHVRGPDPAPRYFVRDPPNRMPAPPVHLFATGDESAMGRCLTVQTGLGVVDKQHGGMRVYVTLADSRLDTKRLGEVMQVCNDLACDTGDSTTRQRRIQMELFTITSRWPNYPSARGPSMDALFRTTRGPVVDVSEHLAGIAGIKQAALISFGRGLVATVETHWMQMFLDSRCSDDEPYGDYPLLERVRSRIGKLIPPLCKIILVCQTSSYTADALFAEDAVALIGVPVASIAVSFETMYLDDDGIGYDCDEIVSQDTIDMEDCARTEREEAALAIRKAVNRPEVLDKIKKWLWRPGGRLVDRMIERDTSV